ncbi:hypothetical protein CVIRNUC_007209 [Coccomyxa viridis]|uniref:Uncharacterized protein n=1 Tax=Coccomyxa viridis TaxID=1274662 RepID=A0AAV1I9G5_9CHLO|nr:hypothetical protein CVIRNUC_007209 [Coccomyxa viridis]
MISSSDDAVVLAGQEGVVQPELGSDGSPDPSVTLLYKWNSTCYANIQIDVNGSVAIFMAPISVGNSTDRCPADESTSCEMDIGLLDPTMNYGIYGAMDAFQMRPVYFNFTAIFQGCAVPETLAISSPATAPVAYPWGRYSADFILGSQPYIAAAVIGATAVSYNITLYAAVPRPDSVSRVPIKAMVMTGSNFTDFQTDSVGGPLNAVSYSVAGSSCPGSRSNECAASLALEASDDMYMVIAFFDEVGFAKQHRNYRMRPQTLGVVLVSYCSAGDGGICTTEALQGVPLDSPRRPGYNDSNADAAAPAAAAAAPAPAGPQPPPVTGMGRASGFTRPAVSTGGPPSWGNATGSAPPPWPAVNATMTPKAPYNSTGRSPTTTGDAAQQQLLSGILGVLGLNGTAAPNSTSPAGSPSV